MAGYTPEPIPSLMIKQLLDTEWDETLQQKIPKPHIIDVGENIRVDIKLGDSPRDWIEVSLSNSGEREIWRGEWQYSDIVAEVQCKIETALSRQRLYDLMQQVRRIVRVNKHNRDFLGSTFQVLRYTRFTENVAGKANTWEGTCFMQLEAAGVDQETS